MLESSILFVLVWNGRSPRNPQKRKEKKDLFLMYPDLRDICPVLKCPRTFSDITFISHGNSTIKQCPRTYSQVFPQVSSSAHFYNYLNLMFIILPPKFQRVEMFPNLNLLCFFASGLCCWWCFFLSIWFFLTWLSGLLTKTSVAYTNVVSALNGTSLLLESLSSTCSPLTLTSSIGWGSALLSFFSLTKVFWFSNESVASILSGPFSTVPLLKCLLSQ